MLDLLLITMCSECSVDRSEESTKDKNNGNVSRAVVAFLAQVFTLKGGVTTNRL